MVDMLTKPIDGEKLDELLNIYLFNEDNTILSKINIQYIKKIAFNDINFITSMYKDYDYQLTQELNKLDICDTSKDQHEILHRLKGSSGNLGLIEIYNNIVELLGNIKHKKDINTKELRESSVWFHDNLASILQNISK